MQRDELKSRLGNLPKQAADYIQAVISKMGYRLKVRREVKAELIAHFEDELKDCKNDDQKQAKAKEVVESFGDAKLLGVLLRRAKKRCRPLWRTVTVRLFQAAGLFVIFFILYLAWFLTGRPAITTDYLAELNRMVRPTADEGENAAPYYSKAVELLKERPEEIEELGGKDFSELTSADKEMWAEWLEGEKEGFDLVKQGAAKKYYWETYGYGDPNFGLMGILLPNISDHRMIAMDIIVRSRLSAEKGNFKDCFDDLITCYRFGRHIKNSFSFVEQLVGIAIEALSTRAIREILSEYEIDSAFLAKLDSDLAALISEEDFVFKFEGERLFMYDEIQRCFTEDIFGGHLSLRIFSTLEALTELGSVDLSRSFWEEIHFKQIPHILFTHPDKKETRAMTGRYYDYMARISRKNPAQLRAEGIDINNEAMKIIEGNMLLETLAPNLGMLIRLGYRSKADSFATVTIIALLQYEQDKGELPDSLEELKEAGLLSEIPVDPWSDEPLIYKKIAGDFTLYSVGENFVDDGGVIGVDNIGRKYIWSANGDAVFWPVEKGD